MQHKALWKINCILNYWRKSSSNNETSMPPSTNSGPQSAIKWPQKQFFLCAFLILSWEDIVNTDVLSQNSKTHKKSIKLNKKKIAWK